MSCNSGGWAEAEAAGSAAGTATVISLNNSRLATIWSTCAHRQAVQQQRSRSTFRDASSFCSSYFALEVRLAGDGAALGHLAQPLHLATDDVDLFERAEELALRLDQLLVRQP